MSNNQVFRLFIDSDVIISSIISNTGAAHMLLNDMQGVLLFLTNLSISEIDDVVKRKNLDKVKLKEVINKRLKVLDIKEREENIKRKYSLYVNDENDAKIVAGASLAKAEFLITYNVRHFVLNKILEDFKIKVLTPGLFLQYLRSL